MTRYHGVRGDGAWGHLLGYAWSEWGAWFATHLGRDGDPAVFETQVEAVAWCVGDCCGGDTPDVQPRHLV